MIRKTIAPRSSRLLVLFLLTVMVVGCGDGDRVAVEPAPSV